MHLKVYLTSQLSKYNLKKSSCMHMIKYQVLIKSENLESFVSIFVDVEMF